MHKDELTRPLKLFEIRPLFCRRVGLLIFLATHTHSTACCASSLCARQFLLAFRLCKEMAANWKVNQQVTLTKFVNSKLRGHRTSSKNTVTDLTTAFTDGVLLGELLENVSKTKFK